MKSRFIAAVWIAAVVGGIVAAAAQAPASPSFEVVSIKPVAPTASAGGWRNAPGRITGTFTVKTLIALAFSTSSTPITPFPANRILGGPDWLDTTRFAVNAEAPRDGQTNTTNPIAFGRPLAPLLRSLLEARFKLAAHIETRELPIYALVVARSDGRLGPKLRRISDEECAARRLKANNGPLSPSDALPCGATRGTPTGFLDFGVAMTTTANQLQGRGADRPILDRTNLAGHFDVDFQWATEANRLSGGSTVSSSDPTSLFTTITEQLGLKVESRREPMDVLVVDHVERPTPD
jgi:uncharacterized protein (TIGR03435 family)